MIFEKIWGLIKPYWVAILIILILSSAILIVYREFTNQISQIHADSQQLVTYNQQMGELFISLQERIISQNLINQRHDVFMIYSMDIIVKHYLEHPSNKRQMRPDEIITFLDEIWKQFEITGINPFIPLAFATIETDFYYEEIGRDGERSIFQFMEETARETCAELKSPFISNWWKDQKEAVRLFYSFYYKISNNFISDDEETTIRWSALAYNAGLYRNSLKYYFKNGYSIEEYLVDFPIRKGISSYNNNIYRTFVKYRNGFELKTTKN
jgi:hypothetical protein